MHPAKWTNEQLLGWVKTTQKGRFASLVSILPRGLTGKQVTRWGPAQFSSLCGGADVGADLRNELRNECARCEKLASQARNDRLGL